MVHCVLCLYLTSFIFPSDTCLQHAADLIPNKHHVFVHLSNNDSNMQPELPDKKRHEYNGEGTLIAMLGPPSDATSIVPQNSIIESRSLVKSAVKRCTTLGSALLGTIYTLAQAALYVLCQVTADEQNMLVDPGVTADALTWLIDSWPQWKEDYNLHTLLVYLPYGGTYMMDEEIVLTRAHSMGIIPVCAAGSERITFPAKLGAVVCVGGIQTDGRAAPCSPQGRELDIVAPISACFGKYYVTGTSVSAAYATGQIAQMCQGLCTNVGVEAYEGNFCVTILKELLQLSSQHSATIGFGKLSPDDFKLGSEYTKSYFHHVVYQRDRRDKLCPSPLLNDSKQNSIHWSSSYIMNQIQKQKETFPNLNGNGTTIAMLDTFHTTFLNHLKSTSVHIEWYKPYKIGYFYIKASTVLTEYSKYLPKCHALRCAAIIANTAPQCSLLMVIRRIENESEGQASVDVSEDDDGEEIALRVVQNESPDILWLSAVTTDTLNQRYWLNVSAHLRSRIVISAAGNEGKDDRSTICYLARAGGVITIGACDQNGERCPYSSVGRELDFLAPGQHFIADSSGRGGTCYSSSAAAAFIALLLQYIDLELSTAVAPVWLSDVGKHDGKWVEQNISILARNTHLMRALLSSKRLRLCYGTTHNSTEGFAALLISNLGTLTPDSICDEIANFYSTH